MDKYSIKVKDKTIDVFNITLPQALFPKEESTLYKNSILYTEQNANPLINELIHNNIEWIIHTFKKQGFKFVYIPDILSRWTKDFNSFKEIIRYEFPFYDESQLNELHNYLKTQQQDNFSEFSIDYAILIGEITDSSVFKRHSFTGFLRINDNQDASLIALPEITNNIELKDFIEGYSNHLYKRKLATDLFDFTGTLTDKSDFTLFEPGIINEDFADSNFDSYIVAKEIEDRINLLKQGGYNKLIFEIINKALKDNCKLPVLKPSFKGEKQPKLSRIVIDDNFRIFLPAYNNVEVKMTPLPKAIYLLFLKHPKGIIFKNLPNYKQELFNIYHKIAYRETSEEILKSIAEVTNPLSNSINEKCSKIKGTFLTLFDDSIAQYYYITGERGKEKKISKASSVDTDTSFTIIDVDTLF